MSEKDGWSETRGNRADATVCECVCVCARAWKCETYCESVLVCAADAHLKAGASLSSFNRQLTRGHLIAVV